MDNTGVKMPSLNKKIHYLIKIIIAVLCGLLASDANSGLIATLAATSVVTFCLYGESIKNKIFVCIGILAFMFLNKADNNLLVLAIKALNVLLPAIVISAMFDKKISDLSQLVKGATLAHIAVSILDLAKLKFADKFNLIDEYITPSFNSLKAMYNEIISQNAQNLPENFEQMFNTVMSTMQEYMVIFIPFIFIASSVFAAFVTVKISAFLIAKITLKTSVYNLATPFEEYTAPRHNGFLMLALFIVIIAMEFNTFSGACYNLIAFIFAEYTVCGVAIVFYIITKHINAKGIFKYFMFFAASILILVISALMSFIGGLNILLLMGMFDANFNFRKLPKLKKDKFI